MQRNKRSPGATISHRVAIGLATVLILLILLILFFLAARLIQIGTRAKRGGADRLRQMFLCGDGSYPLE